MTDKNFIIKFGSLIKEETLEVIDSKILPHTIVLEATNPFPGYYEYYEGIQKDVTPHYIYLVTDKKYDLEQFTRTTQKIMADTNKKYHAAQGTITIFNNVYHVIRIRRLTKYDQIQDLQSCYLEEGISLKSNASIPHNSKAMIQLDKFFALEEIGDGFYLDTVEANHGYFKIPKQLSWSEFEDLTKQVKYNMDLLHFDASIGFIYDHFKAVDIIRIYAENLNLDLLKKIRLKFVERIK
ncbi:hypothetical protein L3049_12065 [Labilibaculum sp. DW002]|uniref:Uncharacterized protein n=1 Tax=Paralabilibaculum antarcticum TaxID=2912572 RepID=A0ABT5VTX2_9BACT|nr:hypothetical protein [Labilibaculum sp. DW002]MDE5418741.1 hypothetical protein [Labilibaculum sp. DW002]